MPHLNPQNNTKEKITYKESSFAFKRTQQVSHQLLGTLGEVLCGGFQVAILLCFTCFFLLAFLFLLPALFLSLVLLHWLFAFE